jgi:uncharacterized membrane protein YqhA
MKHDISSAFCDDFIPRMRWWEWVAIALGCVVALIVLPFVFVYVTWAWVRSKDKA